VKASPTRNEAERRLKPAATQMSKVRFSLQLPYPKKVPHFKPPKMTVSEARFKGGGG